MRTSTHHWRPRPWIACVLALLVAAGALSLLSPAGPATAVAMASQGDEPPIVRTDVVTLCIDGPNESDQMFEVSCTDATQQTPRTLCLYQYALYPSNGSYDHVGAYEIGKCAARGDAADPSELCASHVVFPNRTSFWFTNTECPWANQSPTPTPTPTPVKPPKSATLFVDPEARLLPAATNSIGFTARGADGHGITGLSVRACWKDLHATTAAVCSTVTTDQFGRGYTRVSNPVNKMRLTITRDAGWDYVTTSAQRDYSVATTLTARATRTGRTNVVTAAVTPAVQSAVTLQRYRGGRWVKQAGPIATTPTGTARFAKVQRGYYRVYVSAKDGRLAAYSHQVFVR